MFALTKASDYGLAFLTELARKGRGSRVSLTELARMGLPRAFVGKIASSLVSAGIINSKEGKNGGFALSYDPKEVGVREALEAIEGEVEPVTCVGCSVGRKCGQKGFMKDLTAEINGVLDRYTLKDLVN